MADRYEDTTIEARVTPLLTVVGLLLGLALLWLMSRRGGTVAPLPLAIGILAELASLRVGNFGFFSYSSGAFLVSALHAPAVTAFAVLGALAVRTLIHSSSSVAQRILEFLSDLLPQVMLLLFCAFSQNFAQGDSRLLLCSLGYFLIWWFTPGLFQAALDPSIFMHWARCRNRLLLATAAQLSSGLWLFFSPTVGWLVIPVLLALADSARRVSAQVDALLESGLRDKADAQISQARRELNRTKSTQESEGARLEVQVDSYRLIERMLNSLRQSPSLKSVALAVLEQVRTRVPCSSVALYLETNSALKIIASITPDQDRVESIAILGLSETLVERAWHRGRIESLEHEDRRHPLRIFVNDVCAVAAPISNRGVIYVGNRQPYQHSPQELQYLDSLARHSWLALQAAQSQEEQQLAYQRELQSRQVSEKLLNRLADLVAGMNQLLQISDPGQLIKAGAEFMQRLLRTPYTWAHCKTTEQNNLQGPLEGIQELIQSSLKARRPILHNEYQTSPFCRPGSPYTSVLVVPMVVNQQEAGFLLAASDQVFEREEQDILTLMALQFGPILETVRLFSDLQVAHERLEQSQAQLIQSSKMAAIGQLAGGVAHELNTPLGAVTISIDAVAMYLESRPDKAKERLEKTRKACEKMKSIIAKLLFYSRDSAHQRETTDLNRVVRDTLDFIGNQIRLDNIEIDSQAQSMPAVLANQNEIQQILVNLLNNAKDAVLMEGSVQRRIEIRSFTQAEHCLVQVRDFGPGVPEGKAAQIFDPFFTTKPVGHGTGLGLSVSSQLAVQNGGSLTLLMHPGPGALFELRLPQMNSSEATEV